MVLDSLIPGRLKVTTVKLPVDLLRLIDIAAEESERTRSGQIRIMAKTWLAANGYALDVADDD